MAILIILLMCGAVVCLAIASFFSTNPPVSPYTNRILAMGLFFWALAELLSRAYALK